MTSTRRATVATLVLLAFATGTMLAIVIFRMWRLALSAPIDFGIDLIAYTSAATRLVETGSPYHPALLAGPIVDEAANVPIGYLYPPPLAQLFVPLRGIPHTALAVAWTTVQAAILVWLIPTLYRVAGGRLLPVASLSLLFVCVASWPLNDALFVGNVSGWITIAVGGLLLADAWTADRTSGARLAGGLAAALAFLKLTPLPFLGAALVSRRTAGAALVTSMAILGVSFALAPAAWVDWVRVLPNLLRMAPVDSYGNLAPGNVLGRFGWAGLGTAIGWALAVGFGALTLRWARRDGLAPRTIAAAAFCSLFLSSTIREHYLAVIIPLVVFAWPGATRRRQVLIGAYVLVGVTDWFPAVRSDELRLITLALLVALGAELCLARWPARRVAAPEPAAGPAAAVVPAA